MATMLARGETLGGYRIEDLVGLGGMAIVYRAEQLSLGRTVALKVLAPQLSLDTAFRERFRREGTHAAALNHPHVVTIYDSGEADGRLYLAMRLVEGTTLGQRMQDGLSPATTAAILTPIATALDAAHAIGLVHRDIKPHNILLDASGTPFLADFGVATRPGRGAALTSTGGFVGSVHYAAPEQIRGEPVTAQGDVYALAALLYQCLTDELPYPYDGDAAVMQAHLHEPPPRLDPAAERLELVIARGMAKDPAERYQRAGELMRDAAAAIAALPADVRDTAPGFARAPAPAPPVRSEARLRRLPRRPAGLRFAAGAAAVAAVALALVLALGSSGRGHGRPPPLRVATSGPVRLRYGGGWRPATAAPNGGFALVDPVVLSSGRASLAAGALARAPLSPADPPPQLVARYGPPVTVGDVQLTAGPARRYTWPLARGRLLAVMVVATTTADVALACDVPAAAPAAMHGCLALAGSARLVAVHVLPPASRAGPIDVVDDYWSDISVGDFAAAYRTLVPGAVGISEARFVANERSAGISRVEFRGVLATRTGASATVSVARLVTHDAQAGCRQWTGRYELAYRGTAWLIGRADIGHRPCGT